MSRGDRLSRSGNYLKRRKCAFPGCPFLPGKKSWVCAAHKKMLGANAVRVPRAHKYGAVRTQSSDGISFASKAEAARYQYLTLLVQAQEIKRLRLQTKWPILINGIQVGAYVSDFDYLDSKETLTVEDVKGVRTALYRFKRKCFEAQYGFAITEV